MSKSIYFLIDGKSREAVRERRRLHYLRILRIACTRIGRVVLGVDRSRTLVDAGVRVD